jgi:hypothetical protein
MAKFTGKICRVTVTLQDMKPIDKAVEERDQEILGLNRVAED